MRKLAIWTWPRLAFVAVFVVSGVLVSALGWTIAPGRAGGSGTETRGASAASASETVVPLLPNVGGASGGAEPSAAQPSATPVTALPADPETAVSANNHHVIVLDPGHGGMDAGAPASIEVNGQVLLEKDFTLRIAKLAAGILEADGFTVVLTRDGDYLVNTQGADINQDGEISNGDELQARVDIANAAHADLLISIHLNAFDDPSASGTETYYCDARPFSDKNKALAALLEKATIDALAKSGYTSMDRGIKLDMTPDDPRHMVLHGPAGGKILRPSLMPSSTVEVLYMSNPQEAELLKNEGTLENVAEGIDTAVKRYFAIYP